MSLSLIPCLRALARTTGSMTSTYLDIVRLSIPRATRGCRQCRVAWTLGRVAYESAKSPRDSEYQRKTMQDVERRIVNECEGFIDFCRVAELPRTCMACKKSGVQIPSAPPEPDLFDRVPLFFCVVSWQEDSLMPAGYVLACIGGRFVVEDCGRGGMAWAAIATMQTVAKGSYRW